MWAAARPNRRASMNRLRGYLSRLMSLMKLKRCVSCGFLGVLSQEISKTLTLASGSQGFLLCSPLSCPARSWNAICRLEPSMKSKQTLLGSSWNSISGA